MTTDAIKSKYVPKFVDLIEDKPKNNARKSTRVLYYLSSFFLKFSKKEIQHMFDHHAFCWNEKNELILDLSFPVIDYFVDERESFTYGEEIKNGSHGNFYLIYNMMTKKIAVQGFLVDKKKKIGLYSDNAVIEDIKEFTDDDFERIFSFELIDYHVRDEQLDVALSDIEQTFPKKSFWEYKKYAWDDESKDKLLGYVMSVTREERFAIIKIAPYSLESEKAIKKYPDELKINFRKKDEFIKERQLKRIDESQMRNLILKTRKDKVASIRSDIETLKTKVAEHEDNIKKLLAEIEKKTKEADAASEEIENTNVKSIKLL